MKNESETTHIMRMDQMPAPENAARVTSSGDVWSEMDINATAYLAAQYAPISLDAEGVAEYAVLAAEGYGIGIDQRALFGAEFTRCYMARKQLARLVEPRT